MPPRFPRAQPRAGFALLITIVLMAMLVLIMVSFSALTRVEIQIAKNYQEQDSARHNALVGLNIALGQLQKYAGPDQRTTATADLAAGADTYTDFDGQTISRGETYSSTETAAPTNATSANGLVRPKAGARFWTGVWGNQNAPLDAYTSNPAPKLLTWLVSGNENGAFTSDQSSSTSFGQITAVTVPPTFTPASILSGVDANTTAISGDVKFSNGANGVLLVGSFTTGRFANYRSKYDPTQKVLLDQPEGFVAAPLVDIKAPAGSVAGLGATATPTVGHFAWWVGDEGVKARINLADSNTDLANANYLNGFGPSLTDPAARQRYAGPARNALELITADPAGYGDLSDLATPNADNTILTKVLQPAQLNFVKPTPTTATLAATKYRWHDISTYSSGVLADSLRGGLRKDLTYCLANNINPNTGSTLAASSSTTAENLLDEAGADAPAFGPTWQRVKDHWNLLPDFPMAADGFGKYNVRIGSKDAVHITPIITKLRFVGTASIVKQTTGPSSGKYQLFFHGGIYLVLGNPYVNNLMLTNGYNFQLRRSTGNTGVLSMRVNIDNTTDKTTVGTYPIDLLNGDDGAFDKWSFVVSAATIGGDLASSPKISNNRSLDFISVGSNIKPNYSSNFEALPFMKDPYTVAGTSGLQSFSPTKAITLPALTDGKNYSVEMELEQSGNLAFDATLSVTGNATRVLTGIYNCALPAESMLSSGGVEWDGIAEFKPSADSGAVQNKNGTITPTSSTGKFPGAVAGGYTLVLNAPANANFSADPAGFGYQSTADSNRLGASFTDAGGSTGPAAVFGYHGGFKIPDESPTTCTMFKYFMDPAGEDRSKAHYTVNCWGRRSTYNSGTNYPIYANLPFAKADLTNGDYPFYSLADLRLVNLSGDNESFSVGHQPTYIFGNSYHNVFVHRDQVTHDILSRSNITRRYFDMSYLLNTSLWDRCFFSCLPQTGDGANSLTPLNRRFAVRSGSESDKVNLRSAAAAKCLTTTGAFNINSTSPEAWRSVLGALNGVPAVGKLATGEPDLKEQQAEGVSFPRYRGEDTNRKVTKKDHSTYGLVKADNAGAVIDDITNTRIGPYTTHHRLTPAELTQFSEDIAREVRKRGPFLSLSQFVNRSLSKDDLGRTGALQGALDITRGTPASINSFYTSDTGSGALKTTTNSPEQRIEYSGSGYYAEPLDTSSPYAAGKNHRANRLKALPGWVLQADVLASLGSVISARSDTFVIRTYGDTQNPVTGSISARAWCEAVVQRVPDYVNSTADAAETTPANLNNDDNKKFGRRFVIVAFRWLGPTDI